jgi:hypothetical protein
LSLNLLDWPRAYLILNEIEVSTNAGKELLHQAAEAQAPHILTRAEKHLLKLEEAGYGDREEVQQFRHELDEVNTQEK